MPIRLITRINRQHAMDPNQDNLISKVVLQHKHVEIFVFEYMEEVDSL